MGNMIELGITWEEICKNIRSLEGIDEKMEAALKLIVMDKLQDEIEFP